MRSHTTHTRDAALGKLRRVNRWVIAGSVALTAVLSDIAANAFPGKTIKSSHGSVKPAHARSSTPAKPLSPPSQAPEASSPSEETAPSQETAPSESAPSQEAQQAPPSAETQQPAPQESPQPAPEASQEAAPESSGPVVSGGS